MRYIIGRDAECGFLTIGWLGLPGINLKTFLLLFGGGKRVGGIGVLFHSD